MKVLLAAVVLCGFYSSQAAGPHLLISKVILNEYTVEGKDLTIKYSLYNIGEGWALIRNPTHFLVLLLLLINYSAAQSVTLEDSTFPPEEFSLVQGLLTAQWEKIGPYPTVV